VKSSNIHDQRIGLMLGKDVNGWRVATSGFGDRQAYAGNLALRAAAAMAGIYGNDAVEALYPMLATDSDGKKLDTSVNRYTLTFPADQLLPANAFWSVTMYDGRTQLLIENPIHLPDQLADAAADEEERGRLADHPHPEGFAGQGRGVQLAAGPGGPALRRDANLLAEGSGAERNVAAAGGSARPVRRRAT
jgi:Protein of unknown function (DUF1214)